MTNELLYDNYRVVLQEVPDEITLCFSVTGCDKHCLGCHSDYLWERHGERLSKDFESLVDKYAGLISCVCFMGGDQNKPELMELLIKAKGRGLRTCLYTGCDDPKEVQDLMPWLDYLKVGHYDKELGGLASMTTNQTFYKKMFNPDGENDWRDITYKFWSINKGVKS